MRRACSRIQVRQADEVMLENAELRKANQMHQAEHKQMEKRIFDVEKTKKDHDQHVSQLSESIETNREQHEERYQLLETRFAETRSERNNFQRQVESLEKQVASIPSPASSPGASSSLRSANAEQQNNIQAMDQLQAHLNALQQENVELHAAVKRAVAKLDETSSDDPYMIDKRLIVNFIAQMMTPNQTDQQKDQIHETIANVLGFSKEDRVAAGLLKKAAESAAPKNPGASFLDFLEAEIGDDSYS